MNLKQTETDAKFWPLKLYENLEFILLVQDQLPRLSLASAFATNVCTQFFLVSNLEDIEGALIFRYSELTTMQQIDGGHISWGNHFVPLKTAEQNIP